MENKRNPSSSALQYMHAAGLTFIKIPQNCKESSNVCTSPLHFLTQQNRYDQGCRHRLPSSHTQPSTGPTPKGTLVSRGRALLLLLLLQALLTDHPALAASPPVAPQASQQLTCSLALSSSQNGPHHAGLHLQSLWHSE